MTKTIKATANQSKRTFTIRCYDSGEVYAKYRTTTMSKDEFENADDFTVEDWKDFLNNGDYYLLK